MRKRKGLMLLDVLIIILVIGVVASLVIPHLRTEREVQLRNDCRNMMGILSSAQLEYFETAGGKIMPAATDSSDTLSPKEAQPDSNFVRSFTKELDSLKKFLPEGSEEFDFVCPLDGRAFIVMARDSFFYSISCPNGHGQVIMGAPTWEGD